MTKEELQAIDAGKVSEEDARRMGIEILSDAVEDARPLAKRYGILTGIAVIAASAATFLGTRYISYGLWGIGAFCCPIAFENTVTLITNKRYLKKFEENTYEDGYASFLKKCQDFPENKLRKKAGRKPEDS